MHALLLTVDSTDYHFNVSFTVVHVIIATGLHHSAIINQIYSVPSIGTSRFFQ